MKKKFLSFVLAVVLCFGMTATVLASYVYDAEISVQTTAAGENLDIQVEETVGESAYNADDLAWYANTYGGVNITSRDISYGAEFNVDLPEGYVVPESGIQFTFRDVNIKADKTYLMFSECRIDGQDLVECMAVTAQDGVLSGTTNLPDIWNVFYFEIKSENAGSGAGAAQPEGAPSPSISVPAGPVEITFEAADGTAMNWITSKGNANISVSGSQANIPEGAEFSASKLIDGDEAIRAANAVVKAKGNVNYVIYDFNLTGADGQALTKFNGHIDISMPIPNELSIADGKVISVYYVTNAGKLEKCNSVIDGNFITFGTNHFSTYVYVEETAASAASSPVAAGVTSPKTGETNSVLYVSILGLAALSMTVYAMGKTKYNK